MYNRIAKTKSQETAWRLIERLKTVCPFNDFVVILKAPNDGAEVHPVGAFHPIDQAAAKDMVRKFAAEHKSGPPSA